MSDLLSHPDFIIIGAMKCATSTLHEQLALQPGIFMTDKIHEPNFFSNDDQFDRGLDWYANLFSSAPDGVLRGESSTHYTKLPTYPKTVARMHKLVPCAKLIYIIRHPIDRLISQYIHEWSRTEIRLPIDKALNVHRHLIDYSRYAFQLQPFLDVYGTENILLVFFERLIQYPQGEFERICEFIGYDRIPQWREQLHPVNVSAQRIRKGPLVSFVINNRILQSLRRSLVPRRIREAVRRQMVMHERPKLNRDEISNLSSLFDNDLRKLGNWLNLPLRCANFTQIAEETIPIWKEDAIASTAPARL